VQRSWQRTLFDGGWAGVAWPRELGGVGATPAQQLIFHEEYERAGGNSANLFFVGISHAGPTIAAHGPPEQRARYLPGILNGDLLFCQCFSEPGAGSDLAALSTRAVLDGDHLVVTGEKRWSTFAQYADHCEMLVRTDVSSKHGGLTFVIGDMRAPGVDVRPLRAMSGQAEFTEVFFDEVRIPLTDVVGALGEGWKVATTTLLFERSTAFAGLVMRTLGQVAALAIEVAGDPVAEARVATLAARALATRALLEQATEDAVAGRMSPAASAIKLASSELNFDVTRFAAERGAEPDDFFNAFGMRIGGGTSEIQRTIIGERVLGLPREPSHDRGSAR
jgi:alkylation response protein AidB-like acyl-CoA dehydrogenase